MNRSQPSQKTAVPGEPLSTELLVSLIDPLISEKRLHFRSNLLVEIDFKVDATAYGVFAATHPVQFKRALSNLIDNAVEAIPSQGRVDVNLSLKKGQIHLTVQDDGKGIPSEILPRLMKKGATFGKGEKKHGYGLYHAKEAIESWGGRIRIDSKVGMGTTVTMVLPRAEAPDWFVRELLIEKGSTVVIFDDDPTIHQVCDRRFENLDAATHGIKLVHLSTSAQFSEWQAARSDKSNVFYLVDYELLGTETTGLDLIQAFRIESQSVLVTSRYEEIPIRERCERIRVKLIPKTMAGFVPISIHAPVTVLIDDDPVVH